MGVASGRKLVITFFEDADGGLVRRVDQEVFVRRETKVLLEVVGDAQ